jgi:hypothetical protein
MPLEQLITAIVDHTRKASAATVPALYRVAERRIAYHGGG